MPIGDGYFGSPRGTFGKYLTGPATSPLSLQFSSSASAKYEELQRRRFKRKHESGFVGNGYWYAGYPNMVGTMSSNPVQDPNTMYDQPANGEANVASSTDGMGVGGTAAGYVGGLGS